MSDQDESESSKQSSALEIVKQVIGEINLPKLVAGPAGQAISKLIAGGVDIPAAWLEQKAKAVRDKTAAKSQLSKTLADAASELVKNDPALVQRAADAFLAKELRHQYNRETIAVKAIEHLKETPEIEASEPDDDWLNMFARHAQEASSERLQDMWARILSGQLRKPQSFSLQTLRFIAELDDSTATLFEKYAPRVIDGHWIAFPDDSGPEFNDLLNLQDYGLVTGVTGSLSKKWEMNDPITAPAGTTPIFFRYKQHTVMVEFEPPFQLAIRDVLLTRIGREIFSITTTAGTMEAINSFVGKLPKDRIATINLVDAKAVGTSVAGTHYFVQGIVETLWSKQGS